MSSHSTSYCPAFSTRKLANTFFGVLLIAASIASAQDAVRPSLAGEAAAEARRQSIDRIPYNLLAGPIRFRFSASVGIEYNDNINVAEVNEQDDFILRPQANMNAIWPITQLNTLRLDIGVGYAFYLDHSDANTNAILLSPGSQLSFDIFVGDFRINFHDRFSLEQDPISEVGLSNTVDYGRFQNTAGVSVLWDLNKAVFTIGYDHYNFISTTDDFDYLESKRGNPGRLAECRLDFHHEHRRRRSLCLTYYDDNVLNDSDTYSAGLFVETQITNNIKLRVAGGYQRIEFDEGGSIMDNDNLEDFYVNLLLSHRINSSITQRISAGHESQLGINSNYIKLNYVRHTATLNIINKTLLSTELFYEDADDSGGFLSMVNLSIVTAARSPSVIS